MIQRVQVIYSNGEAKPHFSTRCETSAKLELLVTHLFIRKNPTTVRTGMGLPFEWVGIIYEYVSRPTSALWENP